MIKKTAAILLFTGLFQINVQAQKNNNNLEKYSAVNIGVGIGGYAGYYRYTNQNIPVLHLDVEFDVAKSFTLAPFINFYTFGRTYYWGDKKEPPAKKR